MKFFIFSLVLLILLSSCTKQKIEQNIKPQSPISFKLGVSPFNIDTASAKGQAFCGERIYSIVGKNSNNNMFLISIITDTLREQTYVFGEKGGVNLWAGPKTGGTSNNFSVTITSFKNGRLKGSFSGFISSGQITNGIIYDIPVTEL